MDREQAITEIRASWKEFYPASKDKKGIICPLCGHGTHGDGIVVNKKSKNQNSLKCFNCDFAGDILDLLQADRHIDFNEAVEYAADTLHISIEANTDILRDFKTEVNKVSANQNKDAEKALEEPVEKDFTEYYKQCSERLNTEAAMEYVYFKRGINYETAAAYNVGFDPQADPAETGYYKEPRIIVPITKGHYVARSIDDNSKCKKLNNKGAVIGIFNYSEIFDTKEPIFIVEGVFDALSILEVNHIAIALNSTSNAEMLINKLRATSKKPAAPFIICMDNDGKQGTTKAIETLKAGFISLGYKYIVGDITGSYKDANDALVEDREEFKNLVGKAVEKAEKDCNENYMIEFFGKIIGDSYKPIATGLGFFDDLLGGGIVRQTLLLLMAAPAAGKTTLCQQIAVSMAMNKTDVIYLNLEMSREQMLAKDISRILNKRGKKYTALDVLQGYKWKDNDEKRKEVEEVLEDYEKLIYPHLKYNPAGTSRELEQLKKYLTGIGETYRAAGKNAPVIILDYLHLVYSEKKLDVQELIKQVVTALKSYALEYNTSVIGIVATHRDGSGKIKMDSGRDSSNIEYTADYQIALNFEDLENGNIKPSETEKVDALLKENPRQMLLRVLKNRAGVAGSKKKVRFDAAANLFFTTDDIFVSTKSAPFLEENPKPKKRY